MAVPNFRGVGLGADVVWTITANGTQYGASSVSVTLSADGVATAPDSWTLTDPTGTDKTSEIVGSGDTVSFQTTSFGAWALAANKDGAAVATHITILRRYPIAPLVAEPTFDLFGA